MQNNSKQSKYNKKYDLQIFRLLLDYILYTQADFGVKTPVS
jgi:hypothetical protein